MFPGQLAAPREGERAYSRRLAMTKKVCLRRKTMTALTKHQMGYFTVPWTGDGMFLGQLAAPREEDRTFSRRLAVAMKACLQRKTLKASTKHQMVCFAVPWKGDGMFLGQLAAPREGDRASSRRLAVPKKVYLQRKVPTASTKHQMVCLAVPWKGAGMVSRQLAPPREGERAFSRRLAVPKKVCLRRKTLTASTKHQMV